MKSEAGSAPAVPPSHVDWTRVRRVLLIRLRSIGDTVLMTPCLEAFKSWRPDVEITVVSEPLAAPLLDDHPLVNKLIIVSPTARSRASLIKQLRLDNFDVAYNMHGGSTATILAQFSGATHSIGYGNLPLAQLLSDRAPAPDLILGRSLIHSVEQQLALLNWSGVPWPESRPQLSLVVSPEAEASVSEKIKHSGGPGWSDPARGGFACIVPGAAFESKRWSAEGFAAVADHLSQRWNLPSVVVAGPGQEKLASEVASASIVENVVLTELSLKELAALLKAARLFVGNDSGPMHIAAALGCPIVAVWGSSDPTVWHPWTEAPYRVVDGRRSTDDVRLGTISRITSREVIAAVDEVLESALEANPRVSVSSRT